MSIHRKRSLFAVYFLSLGCLLLFIVRAQGQQTGSWGDQGNGSFVNPVLNADYSDPDVIRVGEKYYMVCSEFHFMGMPVLESNDMVNWRIIAQIYKKIDFPSYDSNARYGAGSWAPSLRYHAGKFWVFFCSRDEGVFMSNAANPAGPWSPLTLIKKVQGWEDPCPFWDEDGKAYLGHSRLGAGPIVLHEMSPDGTKLLDEGKTIYDGPVAEGTKFYRLNGYYYLCIPEGGVGGGWQTALRSKDIYGPYEKKIVLESGSSGVNGPHQGALVSTPNGQWWFYHFQAKGALGRVVHLEPVKWVDDWPLIGVDANGNGVGEPVHVWQKPDVGRSFPILAPQSDDDFNSPVPGLQWQVNHNPASAGISLTGRKGWLELKALKAAGFMKAKNTLTQKIMGESGQAATELDPGQLKEGQKAGLAVMSDVYDLIGVTVKAGHAYLFVEENGKRGEEKPVEAKKIYLRVKLDLASNANQFYYSEDDKAYYPLGKLFEARSGNWKGSRLALFSYNEQQQAGIAYFNWFSYQYDGPKQGACCDTPVYKRKDAAIQRRVDDLLSRMTLKEKIRQLENKPSGRKDEIEKIFAGESYGCTHEMSTQASDCADMYQELQTYLLTKTRLGIPILTAAEGIEGIIQNGCTVFPQALAQGSTFNPQLIQKMTEAAGSEASAIGIHQILSPVLDLARELRWGRVEETFGEDPFLTASIATAFIDGYQHYKITCTPKHYLAHGSPSGGLNCANVSGGERELRSVYMYPFQKVIAATNPLSLMSCYSSYDGLAVSGSHYYMTDILRGELGFKGYVYSDWGSVDRLMSFHHAVESRDAAARMSLTAGVDLDIDGDYETLEQSVKEGTLDISTIDTAVKRVLRVKFALGLFDDPYGKPNEVKQIVHAADKLAVAKAVADESVVLVKNTNDILPLDLSKYHSIAVVGPNSDQTIFGDYSWTRGDTKEGINLLQGLQSAIGQKVQLRHQQGCDWWSQDTTGIAAAVRSVDSSDLAIVAIGTRSVFLGRGPKNVTAGEGFDLSSLELPGKQELLLKAIKATGKPMIVVFISGKPLAMPWVRDNADAVLVQWYGGEEQGRSMADVLTGAVNPSGRLNVSFPRSTGNTPCYYNHYVTDRNEPFDRPGTPQDPKGHYIFDSPDPLWAFGFGLSYTHFNYLDCRIKDSVLRPQDTVRIEVTVENAGQRDGQEVVQVYVRDVYSSVATPVQQLKAFRKETIQRGQRKVVSLAIPVSELGLYNDRMQYVVEPGAFDIQIGSASNAIHFHKTIQVKA
jgi:beta-glucosidase